jgi:putative nucleotidyltransferase with HDIG domain
VKTATKANPTPPAPGRNPPVAAPAREFSAVPRHDEIERPRGRIVYTFLLVLLLAGLLPLAIVAQKLIAISRESLITSQQEVQLQMASSIARQIEASLQARVAELARLAEGTSVARGEVHTPEAANAALQRYLGNGLVLLRLTAPGVVPIEARESGLRLPGAAESAIAGLSAGDGQPALGETIQFPGSGGARALLPIAVPAGTAGSGRVLTGVVDLSALWAPISSTSPSGYTVYLLDRNANLLASVDETGTLQRDDLRSYGVVQEFQQSGGRSAITTGFTTMRDGKPVEYLASVDGTSQGWGIFVQLEKRKAYAAVEQMVRTTVIWAGLAAGLALVLAYLLAATVTRPIHALAAGTEAFARGALDHRVAVSSRNELGALAATFNGMARQMQEYIQRLKVAAQVNNELFMGTIRALADAIDEKDPYTRGHSERVNHYAVLLAKQLGLEKKEIRQVHIASLFHDIGKIGIEDKILRKPAMLTDEEYTVMKQHPEKGAQMLSKIKALHDIIPGMRFHHERWDGTGYPLGLKGEQIPVPARIVAVADAFDAMTTNRPYQKAMPFDKAIERLLELSERVYDRKVVIAFAEAFRAGQFKQPHAADVEEQ